MFFSVFPLKIHASYLFSSSAKYTSASISKQLLLDQEEKYLEKLLRMANNVKWGWEIRGFPRPVRASGRTGWLAVFGDDLVVMEYIPCYSSVWR